MSDKTYHLPPGETLDITIRRRAREDTQGDEEPTRPRGVMPVDDAPVRRVFPPRAEGITFYDLGVRRNDDGTFTELGQSSVAPRGLLSTHQPLDQILIANLARARRIDYTRSQWLWIDLEIEAAGERKVYALAEHLSRTPVHSNFRGVTPQPGEWVETDGYWRSDGVLTPRDLPPGDAALYLRSRWHYRAFATTLTLGSTRSPPENLWKITTEPSSSAPPATFRWRASAPLKIHLAPLRIDFFALHESAGTEQRIDRLPVYPRLWKVQHRYGQADNVEAQDEDVVFPKGLSRELTARFASVADVAENAWKFASTDYPAGTIAAILQTGGATYYVWSAVESIANQARELLQPSFLRGGWIEPRTAARQFQFAGEFYDPSAEDDSYRSCFVEQSGAISCRY